MRCFTRMILLLQFSFHLSQHWHPYLFYITCHLSFMDFLALYHIVLYRAKFTTSSTSNITTSSPAPRLKTLAPNNQKWNRNIMHKLKATYKANRLPNLDESTKAASSNNITLPPHNRFGRRPFRRLLHDDGHMRVK